MSPETKRVIFIAAIATVTVVGVLIAVSLVGRAVSPRALVRRAGVQRVT